MNDITAKPDKAPLASELIADLIELLEVERLDRDLYRGRRKKGGVGRVFGGQVIAQALMAASLSIEDEKAMHSLHAYFMRPGDENLPIIFRVERDFDGGSFANRRVIAMQNGKPILNLTSSFQRKEEGLSHMAPMPQVPPPDNLTSLLELAQKYEDVLPPDARDFMKRPSAIELRPVTALPFLPGEKRDPANQCWFRAVAPVRDDPRLHRVMLAHASDMVLLSTSLLPHGINWVTHKIQTASLDHALWFHEDVRIDDWLLYVTDSPWAGHARGFNRGSIYTREGKLIASVAQEGLIRIRN
ncbi:MAG: acyl-CoA thioesterase II [Alphaproteobacteria bacterium]|nr:acyl-CoA thioesterase II [Alphaproteobacteria bacterium]